jgi:hypothetical protein
LVNKRFRPPLTDNPIGEFTFLRCDGSVDDFAKRFMAFSCRDTTITKAHQVQLFLTRLEKPLSADVALHQPPTLNNAVMLARAYEQCETVSSLPVPRQHPSSCALSKRTGPASGAVSPASAASSLSMANPASSVRRLTPAEVAQRHKDGQCFHCDEFFTNGHKQVCKQLFCIEVVDDDYTPANATDTTVISIHALTGIRPRTRRTMQLCIVINDARITTLLDSRSTHNFVDLDTTTRIGIKFGSQAGLRVTVANDECVQSPGCSKDLPITIGDEPFTLNCFGLVLGSYKMVLNVQWLESLGPILWDFAARTIVFIRNGHRVCWQATEPMSSTPPLLSITVEVLEDLLHRFEGVFATPVGLPPVRPRRHQIRLLPSTAPVAMRPYCYAHL